MSIAPTAHQHTPQQLPDKSIVCNGCDEVLKPAPTMIILEDSKKPCGCRTVKYADERVETTPCEGHKPMFAMAHQLTLAKQQLVGLNTALANIARYAGAYKIIGEGCRLHPAYRAKKKPIPVSRGTKNCRCHRVWNARLFLDKNFKEGDKNVALGDDSYRPLSQDVVPDNVEELAREGEETAVASIKAGEVQPLMVKGG